VRPRAELAAALRPGDLVVTFLVAENHAYAWAFDRDTFLGYPLPPPQEIAVAVERINAYVAKNDRGGVQRIATDLMPALLGPVADRLAALSRVIFVMDGPLRRLSIAALPVDDETSTLGERVAVATVDDRSLIEEIARPSRRDNEQISSLDAMLVAGAIVLIIVAGITALKRRSSIA
jgi:hypothetical protein